MKPSPHNHPTFHHTAEPFAGAAGASDRTADWGNRMAMSSDRAVDTFDRMADSSDHAVDTFDRMAESSDRAVDSSDRMAGSSDHAVDSFYRTGKSFCREVKPSKSAKNGKKCLVWLPHGVQPASRWLKNDSWAARLLKLLDELNEVLAA